MTAARAPGLSNAISDVISDLRKRISTMEDVSPKKAGCLGN